MRNEEWVEQRTVEGPKDPAAAGRAAGHVAEMARTLVAMGAMATAISSSMRAGTAEATAIRQFLPELASRYAIKARVEEHGTTLTVTFERRLP